MNAKLGFGTRAKRLSSLMNEPSNPQSFSARARQRRWDKLLAEFPDFHQMTVLDLGGRPQFWHAAPYKPRHVTTINLESHASDDLVTAITGDACRPDKDLLKSEYDIVVSNSVMEHVGGHLQRRQLARSVSDLAPYHWVQTPYRYFPMEPHWLFPAFQFLPFATRVWITRHWPLGHNQREDLEQALDIVHEVELQSRTQMRSYFPESFIWTETILGIPKSLVAIKSASGDL